MNKTVKGALIFLSGAVVGFGFCGYKILKYSFKNERVRKTLKRCVADKVEEMIFGDEYEERADKRKVNYRDYHGGRRA